MLGNGSNIFGDKINLDISGEQTYHSASQACSPGKKRIPGLSQEYTIRKITHPPEEFTFKP